MVSCRCFSFVLTWTFSLRISLNKENAKDICKSLFYEPQSFLLINRAIYPPKEPLQLQTIINIKFPTHCRSELFTIPQILSQQTIERTIELRCPIQIQFFVFFITQMNRLLVEDLCSLQDAISGDISRVLLKQQH